MRSLCLLVAVGGITGCAAGPADAQESEGRARYFLSPMGELFRSGGNDRSPHEAWFVAADLDASGYLDLREMQQDALRFFRLLDADGSGEIGTDEITRYQTEMVPGAVGRQAFGGNGGRAGEDRSGNRSMRVRQGGGSVGGGMTSSAHPIATADRNADGRITREEFLLAAEERWRNLDANKDGRLTLDEAARNLGAQAR